MFEKLKEKLFGICDHDFVCIHFTNLKSILDNKSELIENFEWVERFCGFTSKANIDGQEVTIPDKRYRTSVCIKCAKCIEEGNLEKDLHELVETAKRLKREFFERIEEDKKNQKEYDERIRLAEASKGKNKMKPMNFPERKNQRRKDAYERLMNPTEKSRTPEKEKNRLKAAANTEAKIVPYARDVKTKTPGSSRYRKTY
jgi:hypothetical protein